MLLRALIVSVTWRRRELAVKSLSWAALAVATSITVAGSARGFIVHYCKAGVRDLLQRLNHDKLTEEDRYSLESPGFKALWWVSYLSTQKPEGELD